MLRRHAISDEHWERIKGFLPGQEGDPGVTAKDNRLFYLNGTVPSDFHLKPAIKKGITKTCGNMLMPRVN